MEQQKIRDAVIVASVFTIGAMILDFIKLILECI